MLLAGDIGGTKTNLAIYSAEAGLRKPLVEATYPSALYASLEALVHTFFSQTDFSVDRASFGVAGPVVAGRATITNLPWNMSEQQLAESLKLSSVLLMNDLEAIARSIPFLEPSELHTLSKGQPVAHGNIAVIAPGTGLGEAFLTWDEFVALSRSQFGGRTLRFCSHRRARDRVIALFAQTIRSREL